MKKFLLLTLCLLTLSSCNAQQNGANADWATYQNQELGISFQYPIKLGTPWENLYKDTELVALKFLDTNGAPADIDLSSANYKTLRTCEDILAKGFNDGDRMPKNCETLNIDNHQIIILTYETGGRSNGFTNASKSAQFQTKQGVWELAAANENLYENLVKMIKTLRYL